MAGNANAAWGQSWQNELKMFSRMVEEKKVGAWNIADFGGHPRNRQIVFLAATLMLLRLSVRVRYSKQ